MFDDTSEALVAWARGVLGDITVHLGPPPPFPMGRGVAFRLLDITPRPVPHERRYRRLHASLRYLATAWADDDVTAHNMLGRLTFAAMQHATIELQPEPPTMALWQALGVPPQPSLIFRCEAFHDLPEDADMPERHAMFPRVSGSRRDRHAAGTREAAASDAALPRRFAAML